ncbi:hypothetical protein A2Z00_02220 [Candidatus Gottesmanbacteria bacterium RBG_13_45_10]|uniref:Cell division protein FtsL n=1 Tax=Candidatus Gottesmanbacteria bacterium RBG_13_45_10 TaxID=1798370 RepID=A0A1F5ZFL1_9BACT|nr:MAG: hypothetical protein A2Z00_02220 [Candidatus Gottesmanbacteria bacterium RBG_13_45_10]
MIQPIIRNCLRSIPFIVAMLIVIEIVMTNQLVGSGREVSQIDSTIEALTQENEILHQEVASASSLLTITEKATVMGFVDQSKARYLTVGSEQLPVALNRPQ